ncbi:MAG: PASTA domain-containing protein, partial [Cetobacterium sp.]
ASKKSLRSFENNEELYLMPDLKGLSAREVIEIFKGSEIEIEMLGTGVVVTQSLEPHKELLNIKKVKIKLN